MYYNMYLFLLLLFSILLLIVLGILMYFILHKTPSSTTTPPSSSTQTKIDKYGKCNVYGWNIDGWFDANIPNKCVAEVNTQTCCPKTQWEGRDVCIADFDPSIYNKATNELARWSNQCNVEITCTTDDACGGGVCKNGRCMQLQCKTDSDCIDTSSIDGVQGRGGICDENGLCKNECTTDRDCPSGEFCIPGMEYTNCKKEKATKGEWCNTAQDCSSDYPRCVKAQTGDKTVCSDGSAGSPCRSDQDCSIGTKCDVANRRCIPLGKNRSYCSSNTDCQSGKCFYGICIPTDSKTVELQTTVSCNNFDVELAKQYGTTLDTLCNDCGNNQTTFVSYPDVGNSYNPLNIKNIMYFGKPYVDTVDESKLPFSKNFANQLLSQDGYALYGYTC